MIRFLFTVIVVVVTLLLACPLLLVCLIMKYISKPAEDKFIMFIIKAFMIIVRWASGAKIDYRGLDNIPDDKGVLYIGNHSSYFDVVFTYPVVKGNVGYIAKKEFEVYPILAWAMKLSYCLFLDREDIKQGLAIIIKAIEYVKSGASIFIFPEGTRSRDGKIAEFKEGSVKIASKSGCPIIPVAISNAAEVFENHIPRIKGAPVIVEFLPPIYPKELDKEEQKHLGKMVHDIIEETVQKNNEELGVKNC